MANTPITNPILIPILKKMCEIADVDYNEINWKDQSHLKITYSIKKQNEFLDWLADHIYGMNMKEIKEFVGGYPAVFYKKKKKARQLAAEFVYSFGFKTTKDKNLKNKEKK